MSTMQTELHHMGDPCVHCGSPHDEVRIGPCPGVKDRDDEYRDAWREAARAELAFLESLREPSP